MRRHSRAAWLVGLVIGYAVTLALLTKAAGWW